MMTLRELLNLPRISLDSKICVYLSEYCSFYNVDCDTDETDADMICLVLTNEED